MTDQREEWLVQEDWLQAELEDRLDAKPGLRLNTGGPGSFSSYITTEVIKLEWRIKELEDKYGI